MKYLIVLTIVALVAVAAANEEDKPNTIGHGLQKADAGKECATKTGVSEEQLRILDQGEHTDDKAAHEYLRCVLEKGEFFSEESGFNVERIVAEFKSSHLDEEKARELTAKCLDSNEQKSSAADWVYRGVSCLDDNKINKLLREARKKFNENNIDNKV